MERDTTREGPKDPGCSECKYSLTVEAGMFCRRHPPSLYTAMVAVPNRLAPNLPPKMVQQRMSSHPPTSADIWCGEFVAIPLKVIQ